MLKSRPSAFIFPMVALGVVFHFLQLSPLMPSPAILQGRSQLASGGNESASIFFYYENPDSVTAIEKVKGKNGSQVSFHSIPATASSKEERVQSLRFKGTFVGSDTKTKDETFLDSANGNKGSKLNNPDSEIKDAGRRPSKSKIFICGYTLPRLAKQLFPDYNYSGILSRNAEPTPNDLLLFGTFGPCEYNANEFPGKTRFLNGECEKDGLSLSNQYRLGPEPDDGVRSIRLYYIVEVLMSNFEPSEQPLIFDPNLRPQTTFEYRAVFYVSSRCFPHRQQAAEEISHVIPVVFGGKCRVGSVLSGGNGTVYTDSQFTSGNVVTHKHFSKFQFCLVMENTYYDGYITEKLLLAYAGGCLPIYYGTRDVFELFDPDSFVYYDINDPQPTLRLLDSLYRNETAYLERMSRPILRNGNATIEKYFSVSDDVGKGTLKRRIREMIGLV